MLCEEKGIGAKRSVWERLGIHHIHYCIRINAKAGIEFFFQFYRCNILKAIAHKHLTELCATAFIAQNEACRANALDNLATIVKT